MKYRAQETCKDAGTQEVQRLLAERFSHEATKYCRSVFTLPCIYVCMQNCLRTHNATKRLPEILSHWQFLTNFHNKVSCSVVSEGYFHIKIFFSDDISIKNKDFKVVLADPQETSGSAKEQNLEVKEWCQHCNRKLCLYRQKRFCRDFSMDLSNFSAFGDDINYSDSSSKSQDRLRGDIREYMFELYETDTDGWSVWKVSKQTIIKTK